MNLKQCIDSAIKNNIQVKQTGLLIRTAKINKDQAKAEMLPNINGNFNYGLNYGRNVDPITNTFTNNQLASSNVGLNANLLLFNGMRTQNLIKQNNYAFQSSTLDYEQAKDNLTLDVILAYMLVLTNEDLLSVSKTQILVTKNQVERTSLLVKEGSAGNFQLTDIKGQLATEEINIINLENGYKQSILSLAQLMNVKYNPNLQLNRQGFDFTDRFYPQSANEIISLANNTMPMVKSNALKIKSAEKAISVSKGDYYPFLNLTGSTGSSYSSLATQLFPTSVSELPTGDFIRTASGQTPVLTEVQNFDSRKISYSTQLNNNLGYFAGLNLQVPLFNNLRTRNRVKQAKVNLNDTQLIAENVNYQLKQNIEQAWLNMQTAFNRYKVLKEQLINFEESFRASEVRFSNGVINANDFLITKNNLDRTKINLTQAGYEYLLRTKVLDFYKGDLSY